MEQHTDGHDGVFVVFEGIDGAGTTTQADLYAKYLRQKKRLVHVTREPSGGPVGSLLRLILTRRVSLPSGAHAPTMALLFAADRLDHVECEILPLLREGYVVLSDRYDLSSILYQAVTAGVEPAPPISLGAPDRASASSAPNPISLPSPTSGPLSGAGPSSLTSGTGPWSDVVDWIRTLNRHARRPDVTVVVDVDTDVAESRRRTRGGSAELFEDFDLQGRLARAYRRAEEVVPGDRLVHVDGNGSIEAVHQAITAALRPVVEAHVA